MASPVPDGVELAGSGEGERSDAEAEVDLEVDVELVTGLGEAPGRLAGERDVVLVEEVAVAVGVQRGGGDREPDAAGVRDGF